MFNHHTLLVGIGNKARHGKSYLADELLANMPRAVRVYHFSTALKCFVRVMGWMKEKDGTLLQMVGTEIFRDRMDEAIWIKCLEHQIAEDRPRVAVIPDCRYWNEARWILQHGGIMVRVTRTNEDGTPWTSPDRDPIHRSEIDLDNWPWWNEEVIAPSGALNTLVEGADRITKTIKKIL